MTIDSWTCYEKRTFAEPPMPSPKILVLPGSTRAGSHNVRLAALAAKELTLIDADVTRISLADYPLPLRSEEHTSELQSRQYLVCRLLLAKKNNTLNHTATKATPV